VIAVVRSAFRGGEIASTETREAWRLLGTESVMRKPARVRNTSLNGSSSMSAKCGEDSMARIVVDPVTRIEGHLRIEAQLDGGAISDAWSSGTMFRGIELILRGRDPREAWIWAQRICGVCTMVHALASVNAVEDALGIEVPDNARLVRNIIAATQTVQDHVVHFYSIICTLLTGSTWSPP
jgi:NADH:ubiquinone oxidoreductase subunit D